MADTVNLIPVMTSNTAPSGVVSACAEEGHPAWYAADDGTSSEGWYCVIDHTHNWNYDFGYKVIITKYVITPYGGTTNYYDPKDWKFQGYNGATWEDLDTQTGYAFGTHPSPPAVEFPISNTKEYQAYRLLITDTQRGDAAIIRKVQMMGHLPATTNYLKSYRRLSFQ